MKKFSLALTAMTLLLSAHATLADDFETFLLNISPSISQCTTSAGIEACNLENSSGGTTAIVLNNCISVDGAYSTCSGSWQGSLSQDGYSFSSSVTVSKTVSVPIRSSSQPNIAATVQYQISASTGPAWSSQTPVTMNMTLGQVGTLTDTVSFTGEEFVISNAPISYQPMLSIGPASSGPIPGPVAQHSKH